MSICCKAIRQIYYNAGSGYTVASYMTNEDLPEEVKKQKNGNYGIFQAFGTELPTNEGQYFSFDFRTGIFLPDSRS